MGSHYTSPCYAFSCCAGPLGRCRRRDSSFFGRPGHLARGRSTSSMGLPQRTQSRGFRIAKYMRSATPCIRAKHTSSDARTSSAKRSLFLEPNIRASSPEAEHQHRPEIFVPIADGPAFRVHGKRIRDDVSSPSRRFYSPAKTDYGSCTAIGRTKARYGLLA